MRRSVMIGLLVLLNSACDNPLAPSAYLGRWDFYEVEGQAVPGMVFEGESPYGTKYTAFHYTLHGPGARCTGQWLTNNAPLSVFIGYESADGSTGSVAKSGMYCVGWGGEIRINIDYYQAWGTIEGNEMTLTDEFRRDFKLRKHS